MNPNKNYLNPSKVWVEGAERAANTRSYWHNSQQAKWLKQEVNDVVLLISILMKNVPDFRLMEFRNITWKIKQGEKHL